MYCWITFSYNHYSCNKFWIFLASLSNVVKCDYVTGSVSIRVSFYVACRQTNCWIRSWMKQHFKYIWKLIYYDVAFNMSLIKKIKSRELWFWHQTLSISPSMSLQELMCSFLCATISIMLLLIAANDWGYNALGHYVCIFPCIHFSLGFFCVYHSSWSFMWSLSVLMIF